MEMISSELLAYIFDEQPHLLTESMSSWLSSSRRFAAFVNSNHNKFRKKLRTAQDPEALEDLRLEFETAYLLLRERPLNLVYEPQHSNRGRSPDFAVSFTTRLTFMVEVTRLRSTQKRTSTMEAEDIEVMGTLSKSLTTSQPADRFSDLVCSKLGQLLPQIANLLLVGMNPPQLTFSDLQVLMFRIQKRAEDNDPAVLLRYGFRDRADFFRRYQRFSAMILRPIPLQGGESIVMWVNPQAKYPLPARVNTALYRCHTL